MLRVLVQAGATLATDQPVLEIETDKATLEVPSSVAGQVKEVKVKAGDTLKVGEAILIIDTSQCVPDHARRQEAQRWLMRARHLWGDAARLWWNPYPDDSEVKKFVLDAWGAYRYGLVAVATVLDVYFDSDVIMKYFVRRYLTGGALNEDDLELLTRLVPISSSVDWWQSGLMEVSSREELVRNQEAFLDEVASMVEAPPQGAVSRVGAPGRSGVDAAIVMTESGSATPDPAQVRSRLIDIVMPQIGESNTESTIVRWLKKVGERVDRDELLFEISTDNVDAEIPSLVAGVLTEIRVNEGETVTDNTVVGVISAASDQWS